MPRVAQAALVLAWVLAVAACATVEPVRTVDTGRGCVDTPADLVAHPAVPPPTGETRRQQRERAKVQFADLAGCLTLGDKGIPAALFRIDSEAPPAQVRVRISSDSRGILAASATLLDARYQALAVHGFDRFTRRGMLYSLDIFIDAGETAPTYLLLTPDPGRVGDVDTHVGMGVNAIYVPTGGAYMHGVENTLARPLGEAGFVTVEVHRQAPAPLKAD